MDTQIAIDKNRARATNAEFFSGDASLITTFRRALANKQDIRVATENLGELILLGNRREYFPETPDLPSFLRLTPEKCRVQILSDEDQKPGTDTVGRNVDELMWQAAFYASEGRLLEGCHWNDVVQLEHWPNLTRLPISANTFSILALLYQHPTSVFFASRLLKVPASEVYQVYSAAFAAGLTRTINRKVEEPQLKPHRNQTMLSSLIKKLARR